MCDDTAERSDFVIGNAVCIVDINELSTLDDPQSTTDSAAFSLQETVSTLAVADAGMSLRAMRTSAI